MGKILLEGMEFYAYHGVYQEERENGQPFSIDLEILADYSKACHSDKLEDAIDYVQVYELVKAEMEIPSSLLENVAQRIIETISNAFQEIDLINLNQIMFFINQIKLNAYNFFCIFPFFKF
jgi:dihydroneopterin aldolase